MIDIFQPYGLCLRGVSVPQALKGHFKKLHTCPCLLLCSLQQLCPASHLLLLKWNLDKFQCLVGSELSLAAVLVPERAAHCLLCLHLVWAWVSLQFRILISELLSCHHKKQYFDSVHLEIFSLRLTCWFIIFSSFGLIKVLCTAAC